MTMKAYTLKIRYECYEAKWEDEPPITSVDLNDLVLGALSRGDVGFFLFVDLPL